MDSCRLDHQPQEAHIEMIDPYLGGHDPAAVLADPDSYPAVTQAED